MGSGEGGVPVDEAEHALLDALFTLSPVGLQVLDTDLRVVRINTATSAMRGVPAQDILGRQIPDAYDLMEPGEAEALLRGVLDSGIPVQERIIRARPPADAADERFYAVSAFRLAERQGPVLGVAVSVVDVTDRERARARMAVLDAVRRGVGRTLDMVVTCRELVDALVPGFADIAVVEVVDAVVRGEDPPFAPLPDDVPLRRVAFRSSSEEQPQAHPVGDVRAVPGPTPYALTLADLRSRAVALDTDLLWSTADPERAEAIRASSAHSLLTAPLSLRGTVLGLLSLYRTRQATAFGKDDISLVRQLAAHAALCIDNARRYTREHAIAATLERHLLPRRPLSHVALEIAVAPANPSGTAGWYDTIALPSARTALVIGDVTGTGINAAAAMGQLRTVVRSLAAFDLEPDELLAHLSDTAHVLAAERASLPPADPLHREALVASCVYAVYDPLVGSCTVARAGNSPGLVVVRPDGTVDVPDIPQKPQLGQVDDSPFAAASFELPEGSILAFADALEAVRHAGSDPDRPLRDLLDDLIYQIQGDKATKTALLLARTRAFPADRVAVWQLETDPRSVAAARRHVRAQLEDWHLDEEVAFDTGLIVSELVTNAVRYGGPPIELRLIYDQTLTCEVRDGGLAAPHLRHARAVDEGGRGLFITSQLTQAWGTRFAADGKTIWTEQLLPAPPG